MTMPRLYTFVACEKVIIDHLGVASLIGLFNKMSATVPEEVADIPPNAVAPKEWEIFTAWEFETGDEGREFSQHIEILYPDGSIFIPDQVTRFVMTPARRMHNVSSRILGFPLGQQGMYTIRMWLDRDGSRIVEPISIRTETEVIRKAKTT